MGRYEGGQMNFSQQRTGTWPWVDMQSESIRRYGFSSVRGDQSRKEEIPASDEAERAQEKGNSSSSSTRMQVHLGLKNDSEPLRSSFTFSIAYRLRSSFVEEANVLNKCPPLFTHLLSPLNPCFSHSQL